MSSRLHNFQRDSIQTPPSSSSGKTSPVIVFLIVVVTIVLIFCCLLHFLVKFILRNKPSFLGSQSVDYSEPSNSVTFQRQLHQLFELHDSGLDQTLIDALPVFHYKEIMGLKEPFDCAVCLCEFSELDKLRLVPRCSHAFHVDCIDTWLLSNTTCPLCRRSLGFAENPAEEESRQDESLTSTQGLVLPVRLGKFRTTNDEKQEIGSSSLDARRCYSMGSCLYVEADSVLQVALSSRRGQNGNSLVDREAEGKRISVGTKNDSFSVSKIWLWSKKGKLIATNAHSGDSSGVDMASSPWTNIV